MLYLTIADIFFALLLLYCACSDHRTHTIPNSAVLAMLAVGLIHLTIDLHIGGSAMPYLFAIPLFLICYTCWKRGALGGGDVKLMTAICLHMGVWSASVSMLLGLLGAFIYEACKGHGKRDAHRRIALAPPLAMGCIAVMLVNMVSFSYCSIYNS